MKTTLFRRPAFLALRAPSFGALAGLLVSLIAPVVLRADVFSDDFNRADSTLPGNGWSSFNGRPLLKIESNRAVLPIGSAETMGGMFRVLNAAGSVKISADLYRGSGSGFYSQLLAIRSDGTTAPTSSGGASGYALGFYQSGGANNSRIVLYDGSVLVQSIATPFQLADNFRVDALFQPDGSVSGSLTQAGSAVFEFTFPARAVSSTGAFFAYATASPSAATGIDNLSITYTPAIVAANANTHRAVLERALSQYFSVPDSASLSITGDITVEAWVKPTSQPELNRSFGLVDKWGAGQQSYSLTYADVGGVKKLQFAGSAGGTDAVVVAADCTLATNEWQHVAVVKQGTAAVLYRNGVAVGSGNAPGTLFDSTAEVRIGNRTVVNDPLDGLIDEVRVWSVARTVAQLRGAMFAELAADEVGGRGYWKLNNSTVDSTSNGNTATRINGATFRSNDLPFSTSLTQLEGGLGSDTVGLWRFEGNANDSSGLSNHGSGSGVQYGGTFGKFGSGVFFNNPNGGAVVANSYLQADLPNPGAGDFTVAVWAYVLNATSNEQYLVGREQSGGSGRPYWSLTVSNSAVSFSASDQGASAAVSLPNNSWHHLVGTRQGGVYRVYVNGICLGTSTNGSAALSDPSSPGQIGRRFNSSYATTQHPFNGYIDDVIIAKRAFSSEEVMKYYGGIVSVRFTALPGDGSVVAGADSNWQAARAGGSSKQVYGTAVSRYAGIAGLRGNAATTFVERGFFPFDTTSLPDAGVEMSHAALGLHVTLANAAAFYVTPQNQASVTALSPDDFGALPLDNSPVFSEAISSPALNSLSLISLNDTGRAAINRSGFTRLGTRAVHDVHNTGAGVAEITTGTLFSESSENKPYLLVEYRAPSGLPPQAVEAIRGTVSGNTSTGTVRIRATALGKPDVVFTGVAEPDGQYVITGLTFGQRYTLVAFQDTNANQVPDTSELVGYFQTINLLVDGPRIGANIALRPYDSDGDGMNDSWETANGLDAAANDGAVDPDGDGLSNLFEFFLGTNPNSPDSDSDGIGDGDEYAAGLSPLLFDTDSDGMPDNWERLNGLNPMVSDAAVDTDGDGVANLDEYLRSTNPRLVDTNTSDAFSSDFERFNGTRFTRHSYDRNDRLIATYYDNGAWEAWRYDGNSNIRGHALKSVRDADGDGLPDAWELAYGLSAHATTGAAGRSGAAGDPDGDGWSNYQEYSAGTSPVDSRERPTAGSVAGAVWASPPLARILPPAAVTALGRLSVRIWDAEASPTQIVIQWFDSAAAQWRPATILRIDGLPVSGEPLASAPTGVAHEFIWNTRAQFAAGFSGTVQLRVTAQDVTGTTISEVVPASVALATGGDTDGDGLPDGWETANGLNPNDSSGANGADGDADGDGSSNLQEFLNGTLPNSAASAKFAIMIAGVGANVSKVPATILHEKGSAVIVSAVPFPGLSQVLWTGGGSGAVVGNNTLTVIADSNKHVTAQAGVSLADALDQPAMVWTTGGSGGWFGETEVVQDGVDAAESTRLAKVGDESWVETVMAVGPGTLSWRWKTQFGASGSTLSLMVNGTATDTLSTTADWTLATRALTGAGAKTLRWRVVRTSEGAVAADDRAWLDTVVFTPEPTVPVIVAPPQSTVATVGQALALSVVATGSTPLNYQWMKGAMALNGATSSVLHFAGVQAGDAGDYFVRVSNIAGSATSAAVSLTVNLGNTAPTISDIANQTILAGSNTGTLPFLVGDGQTPAASLTVSVTTSNPTLVPIGGVVFGGAGTNRTVTVTPAPGQTGSATLTISVNDGSLSASDTFTLSVLPQQNAPVILAGPPNRVAGVGSGTIFPVVVAGQAPLSFQWKKNGGPLGDDGRLAGTASSTLSVADLALTDSGAYSVTVSNAHGSATSSVTDGNLAVVDARATHAVLGAGYQAGGTVTVLNTLTYSGGAAGLGWAVTLPAGWSFASASGSAGVVTPAAGTSGLIEWAWLDLPPSPLAFNYTLNVPAGATGTKEINALIVYRRTDLAGPAEILAKPAPLVLKPVPSYHSADTTRDFMVDLSELLRVIQLYNSRIGNVRTGAYQVASTATEDGFAPDLARTPGAVVKLEAYHSADTNNDARLNLLELTRVIELYNFRVSTNRTGQYRIQAGTEDGFAPGP